LDDEIKKPLPIAKPPLKVESSVIILMLTTTAYLVAFAYDCGYLSFFAIPWTFAEVSLRGAFLAVASASIFWVVFQTADLFWKLIPKDLPKSVETDFIFYGTLDIAGVAALLLLGPPLYVWLVILGLLAVMSFVALILPRLRHGSYAAAAAAVEERREDVRTRETGPSGCYRPSCD
jgi:hypothetical protein